MATRETKKAEIKIEQEEHTPPFVVEKHPIDGVPVMLRDPKFMEVPHAQTTVMCATADSFADAVLSLKGPNRLVTLSDVGGFAYVDAWGQHWINGVRFTLRKAATASILMLECDRTFSQQELLRWCAQWPDTLEPVCDTPQAMIENLSRYTVKGSKNVQIEHGDQAVSIMVEKTRGDGGTEVPRLWTARSAVYEDGERQEVTLRLDVEEPEISNDGKLTGELSFTLSLWTPDAEAVKAAAMQAAIAKMAEVLGEEFTILRGVVQ